MVNPKSAAERLTNWVLITFLVLSASTLSTLAQFDKGQVAGFVRDQTGATVPGATVTVTNTQTKLARSTVADSTGYYIITNLQPGDYDLSIEMTGFKKFAQTGVKVDAASKVTIDAALQLGEVAETVTVEGTATMVQRDTAQVAKIVEAKDIQELMLNGRNPINLAMLKPGVRGGNFNEFQPDSLTTGGFNINGSRSDENLITIDGAIASRTRSTGAVIGTLNVDTVQEVKVLTSNYLPEYGRSSGGQIRFVTKSGGRDFHGDFFEFFRNSRLDGNTWSRNRADQAGLQPCGQFPKAIHCRPAPFRYNQYGYDVGGPIVIPGMFNQDRNKLFFFWAQEWIRWRQEQTSVGTVPTLAMRRGDFSELLDPNNGFFPTARVIPFPGNVIPPDQLSRNGLGLLNAFPAPTPGFRLGAANWIGTNPNPRDTRKDTLRIDYILNEKNQISFRGSLFSWKSVDAFRGPSSGLFVGFDRAPTDWDRPNRTMALSWTRTFSPSLINEFTFGASDDVVHIGVFKGAPFQRSRYGISYPYIFPGVKEIDDKIPTINVSNFNTVDGGPYPAFSSGPIFTWSDNLTKIWNRHTIKGGVFAEYSGENDFDQINVSATLPGATNNQNGRFEFTDGRRNATGVAVANVAMGLFNAYGEIGRRAYTPWRALAWDFFIQDSWKVRNDLTLEFGTRYVYWPPWYSLWNNIAMFHPDFFDRNNMAVVDPAGGFIVSGDPFNGIVLPGSGFNDQSRAHGVEAALTNQFNRLFHGLPRGFSKTHKNVWEPRFGIAYSLNPKTVFRFGGGIFHNRVTLNDSTLLGGNAPIQFMVGVTDGVVDAPGGAVRRNFPFLLTMQDPIFKHPTAYDYSLTIQRELPSNTTIEVAYVGRIGTHLQRERNINQLLPGTLQANPGINPDALRPFRGQGIIRLSENAGRSAYHGFQLSIDRRYQRGLALGMAYTLSKLTSNADDKRDVLFNAYDDRGFKGLSRLDRTHIFNVHYIYELPFFREQDTLLKRIAGGWQVTGVTFIQSGEPLWVTRGDDRAGVGETTPQPWDLVGDPRANSNQQFSVSNADNNFWFNSQAFAQPAAGRFGNLGRNNTLRGPRFQSWDIALLKNIRMTESTKLEFRSEFFNFPNHPNLENPVTDPRNSAFGRVNGKRNDRRQIQFGLKLSF